MIKLSTVCGICNVQAASAFATHMGWFSLHGELLDSRISGYTLSSSLFSDMSLFRSLWVLLRQHLVSAQDVSTVFLYIPVRVPHMPSSAVCQLSTVIPSVARPSPLKAEIHPDLCSRQARTLTFGWHCLLGPRAVVLGHSQL